MMSIWCATRMVSLPPLSPAPTPAEAAPPIRRGPGRPRVHTEPSSGEAPTAVQRRAALKREKSLAYYYSTHEARLASVHRRYAEKRASMKAMIERVAELEAAAATAAAGGV